MQRTGYCIVLICKNCCHSKQVSAGKFVCNLDNKQKFIDVWDNACENFNVYDEEKIEAYITVSKG